MPIFHLQWTQDVATRAPINPIDPDKVLFYFMVDTDRIACVVDAANLGAAKLLIADGWGITPGFAKEEKPTSPAFMDDDNLQVSARMRAMVNARFP